MEIVRDIAGLKARIARMRADNNKTVGFVPTMGYLHSGHASLMETARAQCGIVVVSIFVNPLQFGANEDFSTYPHDEARDAKLAENAGVDLLFMPDTAEMYPHPIRTIVSVSGLTTGLCGASRPGHFDGVSTVVSKLFHIVQPDRAYFGMKDAQQVAVIQQMTQDLNMNVEIVPCPTLREPDGLALSSRNVYLNEEERKQAVILSRALKHAGERLELEPAIPLAQLREQLIAMIQSVPLALIDYVEIVSYPGLEPLERAVPRESLLVALAVKFGKTRLIDNRLIEAGREG